MLLLGEDDLTMPKRQISRFYNRLQPWFSAIRCRLTSAV